MDYFTALLESYSKLKKRTLKLLVENQDPQMVAKQELMKAQSSNPPPTLSQPYIAQGVRARVSIFQTPKGWKYAPVSSDGFPNAGKSRFIDQDFNTFVGYFKVDGVDQDPQTGFQKAAPGATIGESPFAEQDPELATAAQEAFQSMALMTGNVFKGLDKKFIDGKQWATAPMFATYVFGKTPQALESQLLYLKTKIVKDEVNKDYITTVQPPDPKTVKDVAKSLEFLFKTATKDGELTLDEKNRVLSTFAVTDNGQVSVFTNDDDSGYVFKDDNGFFKNLLAATQHKHNFKIREINTKRKVSKGIDNQIRVVALEEILPVFSLQRRMQELAMAGMNTKPLAKLASDLLLNVKAKLAKLSLNYETWIKAHQQSALPPEDVEIINEVGALVGPDGNKIITAMMNVSKQSLAVRQPDLIITKGREAGEGRRQDTFEIFTDFNKAKMALAKTGYDDESIQMKGLIKQATIEEVLAGREDMYKASIKSGLFQKGQKVFYTPISLKNYISLDKAVFGTSTQTSINDFLSGNTKDPENLFQKKFQEITALTPESQKNLQKYNQDIRGIWDKIDSVPKIAKVKNGRGSLISSKPFREFIQSALDIIQKNSTFEELYDTHSEDNPKNKITTIIKKYLDDKDTDDGELQDKIKAYVAQYTKNAKLISDLQAGDLNAKYYLAAKLFNTGGSFDDGLVCDYRGLGTKENYSFLQNDVVREVLQSFMANDGKWTLQAKGNSFSFVNALNPNMKVTMLDKVEGRDSIDGGSKFSSKTSLEVNRDVLKAYNKLKPARESIIESWMQQQKMLLEELLGLRVEKAIF